MGGALALLLPLVVVPDADDAADESETGLAAVLTPPPPEAATLAEDADAGGDVMSRLTLRRYSRPCTQPSSLWSIM